MNYPEQLTVGSSSYNVHYKSVFKATSSVRIRKNAVHVSISRYVRSKQRDELVEKFLAWAEKKLLKVSSSDFIEPTYEDGGRVAVHNRIYEISVFEEERKSVRAVLVDGFLIEIHLPVSLSRSEKSKKTKFLVEKIIMEDQLPYLKQTLDDLNRLYFQKEYKDCRFKRVGSRFGSCSNKGNINIAYRLLFAPREVFRYVCVHELAHLIEFNHSKRFWTLVAEACPDYKEGEKWLRNSGFMLG